MAVLDKIVSFLKIAWAKQPVLVVPPGISSVAIVLPFVSPYIKYTEMANRATPYVYPASPKSCPYSQLPLLAPLVLSASTR
ncbi:NADH dehydrogenase [ubiquinone] 1 alpha subcomplex subunit 3 isoform X2 [Alligator sinensis]|uniref:NADH dehydrogenase [ubiquinone] 1 alpha subcomplex subunit 3 n=1 Tax=Alligator sinensis TaxID=38654 RepID=A0A3Q0G162_ALLSI|nr:NADH dehydrogenase [ubiquinone] 1 alpha subcomplex subunit 3 isoform X2 [Alligator sinensis]